MQPACAPPLHPELPSLSQTITLAEPTELSGAGRFTPAAHPLRPCKQGRFFIRNRFASGRQKVAGRPQRPLWCCALRPLSTTLPRTSPRSFGSSAVAAGMIPKPESSCADIPAPPFLPMMVCIRPGNSFTATAAGLVRQAWPPRRSAIAPARGFGCWR